MIELMPVTDRMMRAIIETDSALDTAEMAAVFLTMAAKCFNNMPEDEAEELLQDLERGELRAVMAALKTVEPEKPDGTVN